MNDEYVVLLKQAEGSLFVFDDIIELGYKIIYVSDSNPRSEVVDIFIDYDLKKNTDSLLHDFGPVLKKYKIVGVVAYSEHLKIAEMQISEYLNLLKCPKETYFYGRDKFLMKEKIKASKIPFVKYHFIDHQQNDTEPVMEFPYIVKPNLGYASGGVYLVNSEDSFKKAIKSIRRLNFFVLEKELTMKPGILCEEFIDGPEFSVDSIHINGQVRSICVCQRGFPSEKNFSDYVYLTPPDNCPVDINVFQEIVKKISAEIGYMWGPSHAEFRIDVEKKSVYLLEIGLRVGFTGNIGRLCKLSTGFDYNKMAIQASLGKLSFDELQSYTIEAKKIGLSFIPDTATGGEIQEIMGLDFIKNEKRIVNYHFNKGPGDIVIPWPKGLEYLGEVTAVAETQEEMKELLSAIESKINFKYKIS